METIAAGRAIVDVRCHAWPASNWWARGIRVNAIFPGYIETQMTASAPAGFRQANVDVTPLGRVEEVAPLVVFLISDEASFISGSEIAVDGGQSAHGGAKSLSDAVAAAVETDL